MSRTEQDLSRRTFVTTAAAILAGTAATVPIAAAAQVREAPPELGLDSELLALFRQWQVAKAREQSLEERALEDDVSDDEFNAASRAANDIEYAMQATPAFTLAGLAAKAELSAQYVDEPTGRRVLDDIVYSLIEDCLRLGAVQA